MLQNNSDIRSDKKLLEMINPIIEESLNFEQRREICNVLKRLFPRPFSKHLVDIRLTFCFIRHWYLVILLGEDIRKFVRITPEKKERTVLLFVLNIIFYFIMIMGILASLFIFFYIIKSIFGIDIFPDKHLTDFL
ncbi:MAG: hypothetical protein K8R49_01800 [Candidatus Cloacimonetes bacterium]|nr:hypothetical protein [Candidatus Cloacimonadota bacterium]